MLRAASAIALLFLFGYAGAQEPDDPVVNRFGQTGLFYAQSAKTLGIGRLVFSAYGNLSLDDNFVEFVKLDPVNLLFPKASQYNIMPSLAYGIVDFLDFSASLPLYIDKMSRYDSLTMRKKYGGTQGGLGDIELMLKLQVPPRKGPRILDMAYLAGVSLPTGRRESGFFPRHTYYLLRDATVVTAGNDTVGAISSCYSSGIVEGEVMMLLTFNCWEREEFVPLMVHVNLGARILAARGFDQAVLFNAAAEYRPASWVSLYAEASSELRLGSLLGGFKIGDDPLRLSPGFTFHLPEGLFFSVGGDMSLSSRAPLDYEARGGYVAAKMQPDWRVGGSLGWQGLLFKLDRQQKKQKQPKNFDGDSDGMPDSADKCPQAAEDKDGFKDDDGCPDYDNDSDRILDSLDKCTNEPEDYDGFEDQDGCPDNDNDKDGIPDSQDRCPGMPEDRDGFEDQDGCPDYDNDLDGLPDSLDKCPDIAGVRENEGCPQSAPQQSSVKEIRRGRLILKGVEFKASSADLTSESYQKLDDVFESLKAFPDVRIEISGYTDNTGNAAANSKLSLRRAETVRAYLILRGVDPARATAVGRGEEDPVTDNRTPEGRAFNRRIEIRRTD